MAKADAYEARGAEEIELRGTARSRLAEIRKVAKEAERELEDVRRELNTAFKAYEKLELTAHENQFRQGVRTGRRSHHAVAAAD